MSLVGIRKIHFIGIGGIGVSAIAKMMFLLGRKVSGSDLVRSEITDDLEKKGATIFLGHKKENLENDTDLVIYSPAVPENNPERQAAKEYKIQEFSYPEFLGELSKNYFTIAVSGTHGKTTTTAMLGLILEKAGLDPTVIVGSKVKNFPDGNFRLGKSKYLVVEGCEWNAHMLKLQPKIIVLTNLEADHLDYYKDIDDIIFHFQKYIDKLPSQGKIILNIDDENLLKKILPHRKIISYGIKKPADVMAKNIKTGPGFQKFDLVADSKVYGLKSTVYDLKLKIPGIFNIYNALAAATCALTLGVKPEIIKEVLENYTGAWRRFQIIDAELRGLTRKVTIVSDYAHHPTAVKVTIKAARQFFPKQRIFVVFQPHHHHRTKALFDDFVKSFDEADLAIISEIYSVAGRELNDDKNISSKDLVKAIINHQKTIPSIGANKGNIEMVFYAKDLEETKKMILENIKENDILLIMGAGDIYKIIDELVKN
ncbi:MAG: UDP-N-acetylmuramate--L-alanine ligase [Patescibacteria group bacterium]